MSEDPETVFIRRGELTNWLGDNGIAAYQVRKLIDNGVIKREKIGGGSYAYYRVTQVRRALKLNDSKNSGGKGDGG